MKSIEELAQAQAAMAAQVNGQGVAPDVIQQTINNLIVTGKHRHKSKSLLPKHKQR